MPQSSNQANADAASRGDRPTGFYTTAVAIVLGTIAAPLIGGLSTASQVGTWYQTIQRPEWSPPNWLFGPVWTCLYISMAVAAVMYLRAAHRAGVSSRLGLVAYFVQLVLNAAWSIIFFGFHSPGWAFVEILALLAAICITIAYFTRASKAAAILMIPYVLWVSFASVLNFTIYRLNAG